MSTIDQKINKDLILREQLAIERTEMANDRTLLSFIRTSLYFAVAGLTVNSLLKLQYGWLLELIFWTVSIIILVIGLRKFLVMKRKLLDITKHIGDYKLDYEEEV